MGLSELDESERSPQPITMLRVVVHTSRECLAPAGKLEEKKESSDVKLSNKAIVSSYWGIYPSTVTKEDGSAWKWNCFRRRHMCHAMLLETVAAVPVQGVFFNAYFVAYLASPKLAHRIVGYLEEEAVISYTEFLKDLDNGTMEKVPAPAIAIDYWRLPADSTLRDVVMVIRADEAHHRDLNHYASRSECCDPFGVAASVESVMFEKMGPYHGAKKFKYRSIVFNVKDPTNPESLISLRLR
ncbi:hypothetical protein LWI28_029167 [Acer negundo]|uniref:Ubiquinol oxidase n=1 Tax=Acer negundo TaxID=4023 RepID=A0AAD5IH54_ACENE|nr:hypothetical protein LWI28_029167 [Acer negundo]